MLRHSKVNRLNKRVKAAFWDRRVKILCGFLIATLAISLLTPFLGRSKANLDPRELEYSISVGPVNGSTTADYKYATLFNPSGSGRTVVVKRLRINVDAVAAATFQDIKLRRISAASAGSLIRSQDIPKKNKDVRDSVTEIRHTGVTATLSDGAESNFINFVPAAAAGAAYGTREATFGADENLVLQPGEGVAVYQTVAGDADQRLRAAFEWEEVAAAPSSQGEYLISYPRVENVAAADYKYHTFFNPSANSKSAVIKRLRIDVDCDAVSIYTNRVYVRRITAASAGTSITAADVPKKHSGTSNTSMELRHTGVTATLAGSADSAIMEVLPCGAANEPHAHQEIQFGSAMKS